MVNRNLHHGEVKKKISVIFIWAMLFLGSIVFLAFTPEVESERAPTGPCKFPTIGLIQSSQTADVSPGAFGIVTFDGSVSCICFNAEKKVVTLYVEDTWGTAVIIPDNLTFTPEDSGQRNFQVIVRVPGGESTSTIGIVKVTGRWTNYPDGEHGMAMPSNGVAGRIEINKYYMYSLKSFDQYTEALPGEKKQFNLNIKNKGNFNDTFYIDIRNLKKLSEKGIHVSLSTDNIQIPEGQTRYVKINIEIDKETRNTGQHEIEISVISNYSIEECGNPVPQEKIFKLRILPTLIFLTVEFYIILILISVVFIGGFVLNRKRRKKRNQS